ncbi:MAG: BMP family ABC transporter substrate-binding protein, partial [Chloroflexi bacterium]|nr:BMP family ABC transporter substrate-binding protein [Chloroflexota bacterium]
MKKKQLSIILLIVVISMLVAACGGTSAPAQEAPTAPAVETDDTFKVGLLSPGSVNEEGWNKIAYDALLRIEDELGAEISYVELEQNPAT